jgi:hypothetical protein
MPEYKNVSVWERTCLWGLQAPKLPPFRFKDESIIPVMVRLSDSAGGVEQEEKLR